jgi:hypothetical protein
LCFLLRGGAPHCEYIVEGTGLDWTVYSEREAKKIDRSYEKLKLKAYFTPAGL